MSEIAKRVKLFDGVRFSGSTPLLVPTVQTHEGVTQVRGLSFQEDLPGVIKFARRMNHFQGNHTIQTHWGKGNLEIAGYKLRLIIPDTEADGQDNMLFYLDTSRRKISAVLEYRTPALYMLQFAELPIRCVGKEIAAEKGIAATLVAGGISLCKNTAIPTNKKNIPMRSAGSVAKSAAHHDMQKAECGYLYESTSRGYGYTVSDDKHTSSDAPHLSIRFIGKVNCNHAPILHGHDLENPSIAILQNIPISAHEMHGKVEPIITDLVHAAATMCPTLPLAKVM